jgi:hypothetical protein
MSQVQSGSEAAAAALVGSLATFSLVDILELLSRTNHSGELQIVGRGFDQRIWMDNGDLVTTGTRSPDTVLFDLACIDEGWFYFTAAESSPDGGSRAPVNAVLVGVGPQIEEWRALEARLPFDTVVKMSKSTPAAEVQIRGDQWQLLSLVGGGRSVREVVDASELHSLDTLRTLGELLAARLIEIDEPAGPGDGGRREPAPAPVAAAPPAPVAATPPPPPAPPAAEPEAARPDPAGGATLPPFVPPSPSSVPPAPEGWVATDSPPNGSDAAHDTGEVEATGPPSGSSSRTGPAASTVMPPPITGDPWSSALTNESQEENG